MAMNMADEDEHNKTTLIVVPAALMLQVDVSRSSLKGREV